MCLFYSKLCCLWTCTFYSRLWFPAWACLLYMYSSVCCLWKCPCMCSILTACAVPWGHGESKQSKLPWTCLFYSMQNVLLTCLVVVHSSLSCTWMCLVYSSLCCPWTFLFYSRMCCPWMCLFHCSLCCPCTGLFTKDCALSLDMSSLQHLDGSGLWHSMLSLDVSVLQQPALQLKLHPEWRIQCFGYRFRPRHFVKLASKFPVKKIL